jgi:hypothetical protein
MKTPSGLNSQRIFLSIALVWLVQISAAQGTTFLSNVADTPIGNRSIGSDSWWGQAFITGTNSLGYDLNSIDLLMNAPAGNPIEFRLSLELGFIHTPLGILPGSEPTTAGLFSFSGVGVHLQPKTSYFLVATATSTTNDGAFKWSYASQPTPVNDWIMNSRYHSFDGVHWLIEDRSTSFQFAINATTIPEPSSLILGLSGSSLFTRLARKSRSKVLRQP